MIADIRQSAQVADSPEVRLLHTVRSQGIVTYPASKDDATVRISDRSWSYLQLLAKTL